MFSEVKFVHTQHKYDAAFENNMILNIKFTCVHEKNETSKVKVKYNI